MFLGEADKLCRLQQRKRRWKQTRTTLTSATMLLISMLILSNVRLSLMYNRKPLSDKPLQ